MTSKTPPSKPNRVTNVQVPGETLAANEAETSQAQAIAGAGAANEALTGNQSFEDGKPIVTDADVGGVGGAGVAGGVSGAPAIDVEAIREQIRAEERAKLMAELGTHVQAAQAVVGAAQAAPSRTGRDYRNLHAHQVDPKSITAPVLTKDGWVCPDVPAKPATFRE
jgi:hypothetical protein